MSKKSISPLRYPGGKAKLYSQIIELLETNKLQETTYIEPFAGGCGLALLLLKNNKVSSLILNDIDKSIFAFWDSVLNRTDELCSLIKNTKVTLAEREKQKEIQLKKDSVDILELGFSTFFLNRVNHSGIIKGGPIGGISQNGKYKLDCRFNKTNLIKQIREIATYKDKIKFYNLDVLDFIKNILSTVSSDSFVFLDPPYYKKGPGLYVNFYKHENHEELAKIVESNLKQNWIVTYDNVEPIKQMYKSFRQKEFDITYTLQTKGKGKEVMIFSNSLKNII